MTEAHHALASTLLTAADLPSGWSGGIPQVQIISREPNPCIERTGVPPAEYEPLAVETEFKRGALAPLLLQTVRLYQSEDDADRTLRRIAALATCEDTQTSSDGKTVKHSTAPLSFVSLGDQTVAYRDTMTQSEFEVHLDVVWIRYRRYLTALVYVGLSPDIELLEGVARRAVEKLASAERQ